MDFMDLAIKEAFEGMMQNHGGPFGAVIVKDGQIISKAHNMVLISNDPTAHAEVTAIRLASKALKSFDLSGCEIYATGEPCPMCQGAIQWARINKIYYGSSLHDADKIGFDDLNFQKNNVLKIQYKRDECLELFRKWSESSNRIIY